MKANVESDNFGVMSITRRVKESVWIGNAQVIVTRVGVDSGKVELVIKAPKDVPILRDELIGGVGRKNDVE